MLFGYGAASRLLCKIVRQLLDFFVGKPFGMLGHHLMLFTGFSYDCIF